MITIEEVFHVPHDLLAEEAFVGGILAGEGRALTDVAGITPDICHHWVCRTFLKTCLSMHAEGCLVDTVSVAQRLAASGVVFAPLDGGSWYSEAARLCAQGLNSQVPYYLEILQEQVARRRLHALFTWGVQEIRGHVSTDVITAEAQQRLARCEPLADGDDHLLPGAIQDLLVELDEIDTGKKPRVLQTCIPAWNRAFGGLPEAAYLALGGRPGTGKTAMMEQIIFDLLAENVPVCVFERDMSPKKLLKRIACRAAGVPFWKLAKGYTSTEERGRIRECYYALNASKLRLHNPRNLTAAMLCSIVRRDIHLHGVAAVFLDHIQVLDLDGEELRTGLTRASTILRANVTETGVPHVVLFHINRNGAKGGRPAPEDVKEFDQLLGDVDGMAMLWSEKRMEDMPKGEPLPVKFYTAKNRDGATVEDEILFDGDRMTFTEA